MFCVFSFNGFSIFANSDVFFEVQLLRDDIRKGGEVSSSPVPPLSTPREPIKELGGGWII